MMGVMFPVRVRRGGVPYAEFFGNHRGGPPAIQAPPEAVRDDEVADAVPAIPVGQEEEDPSEMSECEDLEDPPPVRDEDGVLYADIAQEGGERFERLLRSLGPEWDVPGYEDEGDEEDDGEGEGEGEEGARQQEDLEGEPDTNEGESEEVEMQQEASEEQQEEVVVRAGHTAQARRRSERVMAADVAHFFADDQRSIREIVNDPFQADLICPETRRRVADDLIGLINASRAMDYNTARDTRMLASNENRMSWQDFEDSIYRLIEFVPQETDRAAIRDQMGPYLDFIEMARSATGQTAVSSSGQRWGGAFVRPMGYGEDEVDSDGEPMNTWIRSEPLFPMPQPAVETERGNHQSHRSREPRWNYSTYIQPTVSDVVQQIQAAQARRDDNEDMFGLANSGYSSNRVQQYRLTSPVPGPSGMACPRMNGPAARVRYRATLGRQARSREIVFGMSEAADRFDSALRGFLTEVRGQKDPSPIPSTSTSCSVMEERTREFTELSRRTRRSGRMQRDEELESERERGRRSEACGTSDSADLGSMLISKLPNKANRLGDELEDADSALNNKDSLLTSQDEAIQAMRRMLHKEARGPKIFVPLRKGLGARVERHTYLWKDVCLSSKLNCAMYFIGATIRHIFFGGVVVDGSQSRELEDAYSHASKSANEQLVAYMSEDTRDISEVRNLVDGGTGENWRQCDNHAFRDGWLSTRESEVGPWHSQGQEPLSLEPDMPFMEERFEEYVDLVKAFYKSTLDQSLVIQADHPYLDRIQRMAYGTRTGYWFRACFEGHARHMIKLCTRLKREGEAKKAIPEERNLEDEFSNGAFLEKNEAAVRWPDGDRDSSNLATEADELIASIADTNERANRLRAGATAMLANGVRR